MPAGYKNFQLRGGVDKDDFPARDITLKDVRTVGKIAWEKWGKMIADHPLRDLISLAYAEGLWHGAMIAIRNPEAVAMVGSNPNGDLSVAEPISSSATTETEPLSVRDLLESL